MFDSKPETNNPFGGKANIYVALHTWCYWSVYVATQQALRPPMFGPPFDATGASLEQIQRGYGAFLIAVHLSMIPVVFAGTSIEQEDLNTRVQFVLQWAHEFTHSFGPDRDLDITDIDTVAAAEKSFTVPVFDYLMALGQSESEAIALLWHKLRRNPAAPMPDEFARFIGKMCDGVRGGILEIQKGVGFDFQWDYEILRGLAAQTPSLAMFPPLST